jgi:hypothetical protein
VCRLNIRYKQIINLSEKKKKASLQKSQGEGGNEPILGSQTREKCQAFLTDWVLSESGEVVEVAQQAQWR